MGPSTDTSHFFGLVANRANEIQRLQPDGFQVGTRSAGEHGRAYLPLRRLGASGANRGPHGQR